VQITVKYGEISGERLQIQRWVLSFGTYCIQEIVVHVHAPSSLQNERVLPQIYLEVLFLSDILSWL